MFSIICGCQVLNLHRGLFSYEIAAAMKVVSLLCHFPPNCPSLHPQVCWICLDGCTPARPLIQPCRCPRTVHGACLSRWQLQSAGTRCVQHVKVEGPQWRALQARCDELQAQQQTCLDVSTTIWQPVLQSTGSQQSIGTTMCVFVAIQVETRATLKHTLCLHGCGGWWKRSTVTRIHSNRLFHISKSEQNLKVFPKPCGQEDSSATSTSMR